MEWKEYVICCWVENTCSGQQSEVLDARQSVILCKRKFSGHQKRCENASSSNVDPYVSGGELSRKQSEELQTKAEI